jgi:hypothetical protein
MTNGPERAGMAPGIPIVSLQIDRLLTTSGTKRPVTERAANPQLLRLLATQEIHVGTALTKYDDSRAGTRMNDHALEALRGGETQQLLDSFAWLRKKYFAYRKKTPAQLTDQHLWDISLIGMAIPTYLALRANPIHSRELPEVIGNIYKASVGFRDVAAHNIRRKKVHVYESPGETYTIANENGLFHQNQPELAGFTCAANESLITKTADALLFGKGADPSRSHLADHISDEEFSNLVRFSEYSHQFTEYYKDTRRGDLTREELFVKLAVLQNDINIALGRDPKSIPPPDPRVPAPRIGPYYTVSNDIHDALLTIDQQRQTELEGKVVFNRHTTGKKKKRK